MAIYKVKDPAGAIREIQGPDGASDDEIIAQAQRLFSAPAPKGSLVDQIPPTTPSNTRVALNAASKGIAAVPDMLLNAPQNVANLGRAAYGTAATAMGRPDLAPELTPNPNYANRALRSVGAINDAAEPVTKGQRILDAAVQGGAGMLFNPVGTVGNLVGNIGIGAASGIMGGTTKEITGSDTAAIAASMLTPVAANAVSGAARNRISDMQSQKQQNQVRDESLAAARKEGFVAEPSAIRPTAINNALESLSGKAATTQQASLKNQRITNEIAVRELGLPKNTPITETVLRDFRHRVAEPYRQIEAISPMAKKAVEMLDTTRKDLKLEWKDYNVNSRVETFRKIEGLQSKEAMLENSIEKIASRAGKPDLLADLKEARIAIAKSYDIERSLNLGDANVAAPALGRALDSGKKITGGLETIAKFQQGPGRRVMGEGATTPPAGVSALNPYGSIAMGAVGSAIHPAGWLAGGLPLARGPIRSMLLSDWYQNAMATPNYSPGVLSRGASAIPEQNMLGALLMANQQNK